MLEEEDGVLVQVAEWCVDGVETILRWRQVCRRFRSLLKNAELTISISGHRENWIGLATLLKPYEKSLSLYVSRSTMGLQEVDALSVVLTHSYSTIHRLPRYTRLRILGVTNCSIALECLHSLAKLESLSILLLGGSYSTTYNLDPPLQVKKMRLVEVTFSGASVASCANSLFDSVVDLQKADLHVLKRVRRLLPRRTFCAALQATNRDKDTLLHLARGDREKIRFLLDSGADRYARNAAGKTYCR